MNRKQYKEIEKIIDDSFVKERHGDEMIVDGFAELEELIDSGLYYDAADGSEIAGGAINKDIAIRLAIDVLDNLDDRQKINISDLYQPGYESLNKLEIAYNGHSHTYVCSLIVELVMRKLKNDGQIQLTETHYERNIDGQVIAIEKPYR